MLFRLLGVASDQVSDRAYLRVRSIRACFLATACDRYDAALEEQHDIPALFAYEWLLLQEYKRTIGSYAKPWFLQAIGIEPRADGAGGTLEYRVRQPIRDPRRRLLVTQNTRPSLYSDALCDVFQFEESPYQLLPRAQVLRRESLSRLSRNYQRSLVQTKLNRIRSRLHQADLAPDFVFPGAILAVLSPDCVFDEDNHGGQLSIPATFGALQIIDGQHRLYAYADDRVREVAEGSSRLLVTAIRFHDEDTDVAAESAHVFVEINSNQTRVKPLLLYDIAYDILGHRDAKAIAAKVIVTANRRGRMQGQFRTIETPRAPVQMTRSCLTAPRV